MKDVIVDGEWLDREALREEMDRMCPKFGPDRRLVPMPGIDLRARHALEQGQFLGSGTFSRVYEASAAEVVKFSWNPESLQVLQRLGDMSPFFPKVHAILVGEQAEDQEGRKYFGAVVERLRDRIPRWVFDLVSRYSEPGPVHSASFARIRLLWLRHVLLEGHLPVPATVATGLAQALSLLAQECWTHRLVADLRTDTNFMSREDGHIVICDPAHPQEYMDED